MKKKEFGEGVSQCSYLSAWYTMLRLIFSYFYNILIVFVKILLLQTNYSYRIIDVMT